MREDFVTDQRGRPIIPWFACVLVHGRGLYRPRRIDRRAVPWLVFIAHRFTKNLSTRRIELTCKRCRWFCAQILFKTRIVISACLMISIVSAASIAGVGISSLAQPTCRRAASTDLAASRRLTSWFRSRSKLFWSTDNSRCLISNRRSLASCSSSTRERRSISDALSFKRPGLTIGL